MMTRISSKSKRAGSAVGITAALNQKSRARREEQRALTEIGFRTPARRNDLLPQLTVVRVPTDSLQPASRRVRRAEAGQVARIRGSIRKFGICTPVLVDRDRRIVHGHGIWEAARQEGLCEVSIVEISHLSSSELRLLSVALNRLGETGAWDEDALRLEFQELIVLEEDVLITGFEAPEIDTLLLDEVGTAGQEEEEAPPTLPSDPVSRAGDVWRLGDHLLQQGDARDRECYARLFRDGERAVLILADPPYNVQIANHVTGGDHREFAMASGELSRREFASFNEDWMRAAAAHLIDGGLLATFIDWRSIDLVITVGLVLGFELLNVIVWVKANGGQGALWRSQHELLPVFKMGSAPHLNNVALGRFGRWRTNVWTYPGASSLGSDCRAGLAQHPTTKPRALLADAILDVTNRGDIVLEPFSGSGSTILAAEQTGRVCRAIEIDGRYCDVAIRRWEDMTGRAAVLAETEEAFADVAARRSEEAGA